MAITKLVSATTPNPTGVGAGASWDLAMAQLTACKALLSGNQMLLTEWNNTTTLSKLVQGAYLYHLGAVYIIDTEDYTIPTPASDGTYYILLTASGDTLTVSLTDDISGFSWNAQHNGCYNVSDVQVLPYQLIASSAVTVFTKRKIQNLSNVPNNLVTADYNGNVYGTSLTVTGAIHGDTLTTDGGVSVGTDLSAVGAVSGATVNATTETLAKVYTGSANDYTIYPIGTLLLISTGVNRYDRNADVTVCYHITLLYYWTDVYTEGTTVQLDGTWKAKGYVVVSGNYYTLVQRVV